MGVSLVFFAGSRVLPPGALPFVGQLVADICASGAGIVTGCASGADQAVLAAAVAAGSAARCQVYCAFGPGGAGAAGSASSAGGVAAAEAAGVAVSYWAGGPAHLPVRARLVRRARVAAASAAALGAPCVLLLSSAGSRGTLAAGAVAAASGAPVFAFCLGPGAAEPGTAEALPPLPLPGQVGAWAPARFARRLCWRWAPTPPPASK